MKRHSGLLILLTLLAIFVLASCSDSPNSGIPGDPEYTVPAEQPSNIPYKVVKTPSVTKGELPDDIYSELNYMSSLSYPYDNEYETKQYYYSKDGKLIMSGSWDVEYGPDGHSTSITVNYKVSDDIKLSSDYKLIKPGLEFSVIDSEKLIIGNKEYTFNSNEMQEFFRFQSFYSDFRYLVSSASTYNLKTYSGIDFSYELADIQLEKIDLGYFGNYIETYKISSDFHGITEIKELSYREGYNENEKKVIIITGGEYEGVYSIPEDTYN